MENKIKNSEKYLKSILGKEDGFSIPENYFMDAEERFSSFLIEDTFSKKKSFSTPDVYFDTLEDLIIAKVTSKEKTTKVISLKQRIYKALPIGVAASILLFIGTIYFNNLNTELNFDNLAQSDIEAWILDNSSEMISQDIATIIPFENMDESDFALTNIDDEDIEDYIIYNDNTSIINEIN